MCVDHFIDIWMHQPQQTAISQTLYWVTKIQFHFIHLTTSRFKGIYFFIFNVHFDCLPFNTRISQNLYLIGFHWNKEKCHEFLNCNQNSGFVFIFFHSSLKWKNVNLFNEWRAIHLMQVRIYGMNLYLNTIVSSIAPKHWTILFCMRASTFSSKCRFGSCLPTFLMANCSGVIFSSSSNAYTENETEVSIFSLKASKAHVKNLKLNYLVIILGQFQHLCDGVFVDCPMFIVIG